METVFDVPLATFLRVVYGDDGDFFRRFHAETGGRDDAVVPPFEPVSGARVVAFSKTMSLPAVIARLLGSSVAALASPLALRFEETQWLRYDPRAGVAVVRSVPALVSPPRGERFATEVTVTFARVVAADGAERCGMRARLEVRATNAWALQPVVEKMMEHRASASFREWTRWADAELERRRDDPRDGLRRLPALSAIGEEGDEDQDELELEIPEGVVAGETLEDKARKGRPAGGRIKIDSNVQPGYVRLALEKVSVIFKNQEVLSDATWQVQTGDRVGLVGANGGGKTTQLRILSGDLEPTTGDVVKSAQDLKLGFLRQEFVDELVWPRRIKPLYSAPALHRAHSVAALLHCSNTHASHSRA